MLTQADVEFIFQSTMTTSQLAHAYSVSSNTIRSIKRRRTYTAYTSKFLVAGSPKLTNRKILDDATVWAIYKFEGNTLQLKQKFGVSKRVAMNIKFKLTYSSVTEGIGYPGEMKVHKLSWDDVCTIRASNLASSVLAELFGVSVGTVNNIMAGRTRKLK